jgi:GTP-binding protein
VSAEPKVAVAGRQNVGKSTLVNRLAGRRLAIAHESAGVTRDRLEITARWGGRSFVLVDTGGFIRKARGIDERVVRQAGKAIENADLALLVVDSTTGIQEEDASLARSLRRSTTPVLVVANKVDSERQEPLAAEFNKLGLGEPIPVSALHGRGSGEVLDRIVELLPPSGVVDDNVDSDRPAEARFALVGRPNVGKSSLFNRLVREERAIVHDEPGTTRDAVDSVIEVGDSVIRFVDTAGLRRAIKTKGVEYYGLLRTERAIESAHVALLLVDASEGVTGEDKHIAARVAEVGRGLAVALNKWDLVPSEERAALFIDLSDELRIFPGTPVVRTSAATGTGVGRIVPALLKVHEAWTKRVSTAEVNRVLVEATDATPPPRGAGHIRYGTQVAAGPPSFVLFGSRTPPPSYRRYLENSLRRAFGFDGVPIRLSFRTRESRRAKSASRGR